MNESLKSRALTLIHMESNPSKEEWIELVRELLETLDAFKGAFEMAVHRDWQTALVQRDHEALTNERTD